jgi:hypothetical protein
VLQRLPNCQEPERSDLPARAPAPKAAKQELKLDADAVLKLIHHGIDAK